jgi:hypothetical protein
LGAKAKDKMRKYGTTGAVFFLLVVLVVFVLSLTSIGKPREPLTYSQLQTIMRKDPTQIKKVGVTNGEDIVIRGYLKPISTLRKPLHTANLVTKEPVQAAYERSDWCVVPAGAVAGEAMVALVLADAFLQKFGGDSLAEMRRNFDNYVRQIDEF